MTPEGFLAFYPQFSVFVPGVVLPEIIRQANARFSSFGEDAEEARRLYTAHKLTLYAAASLPENTEPTMAQLAEAGKGHKKEIAAKKVGEVSIEYARTDPDPETKEGLPDLKKTTFGQQLETLLRLHSFSTYIP